MLVGWSCKWAWRFQVVCSFREHFCIYRWNLDWAIGKHAKFDRQQQAFFSHIPLSNSISHDDHTLAQLFPAQRQPFRARQHAARSVPDTIHALFASVCLPASIPKVIFTINLTILACPAWGLPRLASRSADDAARVEHKKNTWPRPILRIIHQNSNPPSVVHSTRCQLIVLKVLEIMESTFILLLLSWLCTIHAQVSISLNRNSLKYLLKVFF